jgi:hypothetical protein
MMPTHVPHEATASEKEVFEIIRDANESTEYVCLHSLGIARHERKDYAEADFVLIGPPGIFCLEVKGGLVSRNEGLWQIGWPGKTYSSAEGPFKQAQGERWALLDYLNEHLHFNVRSQLIFGWGVIFPDIVFDLEDPEWDNRVIYDQRDKKDSFVRYVERLAQYFRMRHQETGKTQPPQLTPTRIREIVACLRPNFDVVPSISGLLGESERELLSLSADQFKVLDLALNESNPRILCIGAAGSGKTVIAMEAARRLAASGRKVLLLCYNHNLERFLRHDIADARANVTISTVHRFLSDLIKKGGFGEQLASARAQYSPDKLFSDIYPNLFESAAVALVEDNSLPQFNTLIIDEAQDVLETPVLNCLDLILENGLSRGRWLICLDNGLQAEIYGRMDSKLLLHLKSFGAATVLLNENFRNPQTIVDEMCAITRASRPICKRTFPSPVEYRVYESDKEQGKKLRALLIEILRGGIHPRHITILSAKARDKAVVTRYPPDVGKPICFVDADSEQCPQDAITAATISGFKGLENEFIILCDLPTITEESNWVRSIFYVGMTRTRTKLFVLVEKSFLDFRQKV